MESPTFRQLAPSQSIARLGSSGTLQTAVILGAAITLCATFIQPAAAQVFTVGAQTANGTRLPEFHPTAVPLSTDKVTERTRRELIRLLESEQGFAMRPIPRGHNGITLHANGKLDLDDSAYLKTLYEKGASSNSGDRVQITDLEIKGDRITFLLNGGPDRKHRFLRHISIGGDPNYTSPVVRDDGSPEPAGSRLTLVFDKYVPELTGDQVMQLLLPVIDFKTKTPVQAYTDTLPPKLRAAILDHQVLVGMNRKMVLLAAGQPASKVRETGGGYQYEEWIYGTPPKDTQFVRFIGDRVVRMEIAAIGKPPVVRKEDETDDYLGHFEIHEVALGDSASATPDPRQQPSLRLPGEPEPDNGMQRVRVPGEKPQPLPSAPPQPERLVQQSR